MDAGRIGWGSLDGPPRNTGRLLEGPRGHGHVGRQPVRADPCSRSVGVGAVVTDCKHPHLVAYSDEDGPVMWACARCSRRFYPACEKCVTLGHRGGHGEHRDDPVPDKAVAS